MKDRYCIRDKKTKKISNAAGYEMLYYQRRSCQNAWNELDNFDRYFLEKWDLEENEEVLLW